METERDELSVTFPSVVTTTEDSSRQTPKKDSGKNSEIRSERHPSPGFCLSLVSVYIYIYKKKKKQQLSMLVVSIVE